MNIDDHLDKIVYNNIRNYGNNRGNEEYYRYMFCYNCGGEIEENMAFCPHCGVKREATSGVKRIKLKCSSCNGIAEVNDTGKEIYCPFCGNKELLLDSDAVIIEKIKNDTYKEIELEKLKIEEEKEEEEELERNSISYKKSKTSKITLLLIAICLGLMVRAFLGDNIVGGIISLSQVVAFSLSWLIGMNIIKVRRKSVNTALLILGLLLIIPRNFFHSTYQVTYDEYTWPKSGLALYLPKPDSIYGEIKYDSDKEFRIEVSNYSTSQYSEYVNQCKDNGFTIDKNVNSISYEAFNEEGYKLSVVHWSNDTVTISVEEPLVSDMDDIHWPESDIAKLIPIPESTYGKIDWASDYGFHIYVGETTRKDYKDYINVCMENGFTEDYSMYDTTFSAKNKSGYDLKITYEGFNVMSIRIYEPS